MRPVIEAEGVSVRFGDRVVLDDVDLRVHAGERVALLGPNGAGKSTLLDVVLGVLRPERGAVRLLGARPPSRAVGFVPQDAGASLLPWLSVEGNVALPLRIGRRTAAERARAVAEVRERVDPERTIELGARSDALSGGEKQRVALMRALAGSPPLLVCDEPFSAIDAPSRSSLREVLRTICEDEGTAVLIATHDADDVRELGARVVRLDRRSRLGGRA